MIDIVLSTGIPVHVKQIPNLIVFKEVNSVGLKIPQPPVVELDDGRMTENTFSPIYQDAITVFQLQQNNLAFDVILDKAVSFDSRLMNNADWRRLKRHLESQKLIQLPKKEEVAFLRFYALGESGFDKHNLTQNAILHESPVLDIFKSLLITRDGYDIHEANIRNAIKVGIDKQPLIVEGCQLVNPLDEREACIESNMDWMKWFRCEYTLEEKAVAVGLSRLARLVNSHTEDVMQIESEKKNKAKK